jgi:pyruvate dehydrogenase complex dehydrogenase (E1) component
MALDIEALRKEYETYHQSYLFFNRNYRELVKKYLNKYVAVLGNEILGAADTKEELGRKYGNIKGVYIDLVTSPDIIWMV